MSRLAVAAAVCLLLAGCAAPTAAPGTPTPGGRDASAPVTGEATATTGATAKTTGTGATATATRTGTSSIDIAVRGGTLSVDHERAYARLVDLLGANVSPPSTVLVRSPAEIRNATGGVSTSGRESPGRSFAGVMGIGVEGRSADADRNGSDADDGSDDSSAGDGSDDADDGLDDDRVSIAAYAASARAVVVNERLTDSAPDPALERTLVHEFVHTVQFRQDAIQRVGEAVGLGERYSRDRYLAYVSVVEGVAAFAAGAYDRRYLDGRWSTVTAGAYRSADADVKLSLARYHLGARYLDRRFDAPRNVSAVYDDPPRTTEQLLHGNGTDPDPPADLSVGVAPGPNRTTGGRTVNGELFTRIAVGTELNASRARAAAAGWGADRLVPVEPTRGTGNRSFAWVTRWDSPAEADEFRAALGAYLDARATADPSRATDGSAARDHPDDYWRDGSLAFRVVRVSPETVVLLAGDRPFVRSARVAGTNGSVSVTVDGASTA